MFDSKSRISRLKNNSILQIIHRFKIGIALFLLITGSLGTIGPSFLHLHSSKDLTVCKQECVSLPIFYQLVNNAVFQGSNCHEKQPNHIHFVPVEGDCLVCNLPHKSNFEIPDLPCYNSSIVGADTFLAGNSSFPFTVSVVTAYNKGSPMS